MALGDWKNSNSTVKKLFDDSSGYSELTDRAKTLTLGDLMRLSYYSRPGDLPPNVDPTLRKIDLEDMKSVTRALEVHMKEHGNEEGWKYTGTVFSCGACIPCSCAATLPPGLDHQQNNFEIEGKVPISA